MITKLEHPRFVTRDSGPPLLAFQVATVIDCDCRVFLGKLAPELERPAVCSRACSEDHAPLVAIFRRLWADSPHRPGWTDLEAGRLLERACNEFRGREGVTRAVGS